MQNDFNGYSLFNDIKDNSLRASNRANVLANIFETFGLDKKMQPKGTTLILGYFNLLPKADRKDTYMKLKEVLTLRGHFIVNENPANA